MRQNGFGTYYIKAVKGYAAVGSTVAFSIFLLGIMGDPKSAINQLVIGILVCGLIALGVFIYWLYTAINKALPFTVVQSSGQLPAEAFKGISFSSVMKNPTECIVVVGSKHDHGPYKKGAVNEDWDAAHKLQTKYNLAAVKSDNDISDVEKVNNNLISVGGPLVNTLSNDVSNSLPISVAMITQGGVSMKGAYSSISGKYYQGREFGLIEAVPNNLNQRRVIITAFGLNREGTTAAVEMLVEHVDELDAMNKQDKRYPAKLIRVTRDDNNHLSYVVEE
jgi:hypothetical protein